MLIFTEKLFADEHLVFICEQFLFDGVWCNPLKAALKLVSMFWHVSFRVFQKKLRFSHQTL